MGEGSGTPVRVLVVDGDPDAAAVTADRIADRDDRLVADTARDPDAALATLASDDHDGVVAAFDLPGTDGIEFLHAVHDRVPGLPFVLYDEPDSDASASEALAAGASDYVERRDNPETHDRLATRIVSAVDDHRARGELDRQAELLARTEAIANVGAWEYDVATEAFHVTDELKRLHGLAPDDDLTPVKSLEFYHPDDQPVVRDAFTSAVREGEPYDLELRFQPAEGGERWVRTRGEPQTADGSVTCVRGTMQDITGRKRREEALEEKNERLEAFADVVSHDIRNPLQVAAGHLDIAEQTGDAAAFEQVRDAHDRIAGIVDDILGLARADRDAGETDTVDVAAVAEDAWGAVDTTGHELVIVDEFRAAADAAQLRQVFENLFRNATEHGPDEGVTVTVGRIEGMATTTRGTGSDGVGFYVADDGPGIPASEREDVFRDGYSSASDGTGLGLSIVQQVADDHGWTVNATASRDGGARFEVTGVGTPDSPPSGR
jgi:PAS domain S-box-containing protein